jgi:RNA polymerase sigma-B factor
VTTQSELKQPDYNHYETVVPLFRELAACEPGSDRRIRMIGELAMIHLPLARNLAVKFAHRGEPLEDLIQVARLGLLQAVDRFDPDRGTDFLPFAIPTITGALRRHFRDTGWDVRVPRRMQELHFQIRSAVEELSQRTGRAPKPTDLAAHLRVPLDEVLDALKAGNAYSVMSLDKPANTESDSLSFGDTLGGFDQGFEAVDNHEALLPLLAALPVRERRILHLRFVEDLTQTEIAEQIGVSQMHVSRLLAQTVTHLRVSLLSD